MPKERYGADVSVLGSHTVTRVRVWVWFHPTVLADPSHHTEVSSLNTMARCTFSALLMPHHRMKFQH